MSSLSIGLIVFLVILFVLVGGIAIAVFKIRSGLRSISKDVFGTDSIMDGLHQQKISLSETPRSLQAMTPIYIPKIEKDFPEFDYSAYKRKCESVLRSYFNAIEDKNADLLREEVSENLKNSVRSIVYDLESKNYRQYYDNITIHQTEISRYIKNGSTVTIVFVSSVGYVAYCEDGNGKIIFGEKESKTQTIYETELVYVQDVQKIATSDSALGINCPNCGAPVTNLGNKFCEYCGAGLKEVNIRAWKFHSVREQTLEKRAF